MFTNRIENNDQQRNANTSEMLNKESVMIGEIADQRSKTVTMRKEITDHSNQMKILQLKKDHLFNDIPKVIKEAGGGLRSQAQEIVLRGIRDRYTKDDVYGQNEVDENTDRYANSLDNFRSFVDCLKVRKNGTNKLWVDLSGRRLWADGVDDRVKTALGPRGNLAVNEWKDQMRPSINAVIDDICN